MDNQDYNRKLLALVSAQIEENPDLRFCQILYDTHILEKGNDSYNEDPKETLDWVNNWEKITYG